MKSRYTDARQPSDASWSKGVPGGNLTGILSQVEGLPGKQVEIAQELGRVLINAQVAAPAFMGHSHRLSKKRISQLASIRRIIHTRGHACADPRPSRRLGRDYTSVGSLLVAFHHLHGQAFCIASIARTRKSSCVRSGRASMYVTATRAF